jgi:hydroxypyruvate isomerase
MNRRDFIAASVAAGLVVNGYNDSVQASPESDYIGAKNNRIKQSVCQWCYEELGIEQLAKFCAKTGIKSIELVNPEDWPVLKKYGLICAMSWSGSLTEGLSHKENHEKFLAQIRESIDKTSEAGFPNVICFSGNRYGMDDDEGMTNCEIALKQVIGYAEKKNVNICMELLNSKVNHKDYMCDRTHWGVQLAKRIGSPNFGLLYDIYHMQVQEGDVIATIKKNHEYIFHYHTAGVPGRHEIDDTQELYYPAIIKAIVDTGYKGYLGQEFIPQAEDRLKSLAEAVRICDV